MQINDQKIIKAHKYIRQVLQSEEYKRGLNSSEKEQLRQFFKQSIGKIVSEKNSEEFAEIEKLLTEEEKLHAQERKDVRANQGVLDNAANDILRATTRLPMAAVDLSAWLAQMVGANDTAQSLAQFSADKKYDIEQALPGAEFNAQNPDSWLPSADFISSTAIENLPLMLATGVGSKALIGGATKLSGAPLSRGITKALEITGTGIGMSLPETYSAAMTQDALGNVELPKSALVPAMMAIPHAAVEVGLGISPVKLADLGSKKFLTSNFVEKMSRYARRYGTAQAAKYTVNQLFGDGFDEGAEELTQGVIGIFNRNLANKDVGQAISDSVDELMEDKTWNDLYQQFVGGVTTGTVYSGGKSAIDRVSSNAIEKAKAGDLQGANADINAAINDKNTSITEKQDLAKQKEVLQLPYIISNSTADSLRDSDLNQSQIIHPFENWDGGNPYETVGTMDDYRRYKSEKEVNKPFPESPMALLNEFKALYGQNDNPRWQRLQEHVTNKYGTSQALAKEDYPAGKIGKALRALDEVETKPASANSFEYDPETDIPLLPYEPNKADGRQLPEGSIIKDSRNDDIITLKSGKPFKNEKIAKAFQSKKNLKDSHDITPVRGGFVLMKKPVLQEPRRVTVETPKEGNYQRGSEAYVSGITIPTENRTLVRGNSEAAARLEKRLTPDVTSPDQATIKQPAPVAEPKAETALPKQSEPIKQPVTKPADEMTDDEWLAATKFYRSGKTKNAQLPNGKRVILSSEATEKTFRETSRDFLLRARQKTKPAESNDTFLKIQADQAVTKPLANDEGVTKNGYKVESYQGGFRVLDSEGKQYSWHTGKQAADDKAAELNNKAVNIPPVLYHGTDSNFSEFDPAKGSNGFWFSENPSDAGDYGNNVLQASITIQNPAYFKRTNGDKGVNEAIAKAKADGYDGLIVTSPEDGDESGMFWPTNYVAFYPEQIKLIEKKGESEEVIKAPATESQKSEYTEQTRTIAEIVQTKLAAGEGLKITDLINYANEVFGGTQADGVWNIKDLYDSMELGINLYLLNNQEMVNLFNSGDIKAFVEKVKTEILAKIPTQTRRTEEMDEFQQFSTPPSIASMAAWLANINKNDSVLEPSAGIGGLAVFGKMAGAEVIVNELSKRRADILANMPFNRFFSENGEQLNNILPDDVAPTVVIMNPPFSSTAGRVQGERKTKNGGAHVEQALKRLQPGGRLIAIVGQGMSFEHKTFADWWGKIKKEYNVLANVGLSGQEYKKYGTTFDNRILVIDKTGATTGQPVSGDYNNIESMVDALQGVRNVRQAILPGTGTSSADANKSQGRRNAAKGISEGSSSGHRDSNIEAADTNVGRQQSVSATIRKLGNDKSSGENRSNNKKSDKSNEAVRPLREERFEQAADGRNDEEKDTSELRSSSAFNSQRSAGIKSDDLVIAQDDQTQKDELSDSIYDEYRPSVTVAGAKKHPGKLVESAAMAAVSPAKVNYTPKIPSEIVRSGKISDAQLEAVIRAGHNHNQKLLDGKRKGFFIGDGTGVGKGREISAIFWDNFLQGRKKGVWVTINSDLFKDARRDIEGIGWDKSVAFELKGYDDIKQSEGILLISYDTLKNKSREGQARLEQINKWLGENFDGVIAFDEAHKMGNSTASKGIRGTQDASGRALKAFDFRQANPEARVLYVSATGATEPKNLGYLERLGLWGAGTAFSNVNSFISEIASGGVAAMEMIAADMKAMGNYIARSLSFDGVTYGRLSHDLSSEQRKIYSTYCQAWQIVLQNVHEALAVCGAAKSGKALSAAKSAFWNSNQRFFNQILTSFQMPTLLKDIDQQLKAGKSIILQLTNTNEAQLKRQLDTLEDGELEDLDLTPTEIISQFVQSSFPVAQMEEYADENGNKRVREVRDSNGNTVLNREAVAMREKLLDELGSIRKIDGPLDMILNHFGPDAVAEITGRTTRVVWREVDGTTKRVKENRSKRHSEAEENDFMSGKKRILVFSEAGGTGRSFHADLSKKNQQHRIHYLVQAGWKADAAIQGLGRSHRTNEASQPHYVLCSTDVPAQVRFTSTIARRLDQLGALTRGQRQTGSQGIFQARDNLENEYAQQAIHGFLLDLANQGSIGDLTFAEFEKQSGLDLRDDLGFVSANSVAAVPVRQFLNRTLSLDLPVQELVYSEVFTRLDEIVKIAEANGTLDIGMETIRAKSIVEKRGEVVRVDEESGAKTEYHLLETEHDAQYNKFPGSDGEFVKGYYHNEKTGRLIAIVSDVRSKYADGDVNENYFAALAPASYGDVTESNLAKNYKKITVAEASKLWQEQLNSLPKTIKKPLHLITGTLLPIWDRLPNSHVKIMRAKTDSGKVLLGRTVHPKAIDKVLKSLGVGGNTYSSAEAVAAILENGDEAELANGWKLKRKTVSGEKRIEIVGPDIGNREELDIAGVFSERIQYQTRFFIPKDKAVEVIEKLTKNRPITGLGAPTQASDPLYSVEYLVARYAKKGLNNAATIVKKGFDHIRSGLTQFAKWARQMVNEFGQAVKKHLRSLFKDLSDFNKRLGRTGAISGRPAGKTAQEILTDKWAKKGLEKAYKFGDKLYQAGKTTFAEWQKYMQQRFMDMKEPEFRDLWQNVVNPEKSVEQIKNKPLRDNNVPASPKAFKMLGLKPDRIYADYSFLQQRHSEYFDTPEEVRSAVEFVLADPELSTAETDGNGGLVRASDGEIVTPVSIGVRVLKHPKIKIELEKKRDGYHLRSVHLLSDEQLERDKSRRGSAPLDAGVTTDKLTEGSATVETEGNQAQADAKASSTKNDNSSGQNVKPAGPVTPNRKTKYSNFSWLKDNSKQLRLRYSDPNTGKTEIVATITKNPRTKRWEWKENPNRQFFTLPAAKAFIKSTNYERKRRAERNAEKARRRSGLNDDYFDQIPEVKKKKIDQPQTWKEKAEAFVEKATTVLFDKWHALKKVQDNALKASGLKNLPDDQNAYQRLEVLTGRIQERTADFREKYWQPILDYLNKHKISYEQFNEFLRVMHAEERNAHIDNINPEFRERGIPGSGMSNEVAVAKKQEYAEDGIFETLMEAGKMYWQLNKVLLDEQVKYGLLSQEMRDSFAQAYKYYTPLKSPPDQGRNLEKRTLGRRSESSDQLSYTLQAILTTFSRGEINRKNLAFLRFALKNPNDSLYTIHTAKKKPIFNKQSGEVEYYYDRFSQWEDEVLHAKFNGKDVAIRITDPELLDAVKNRGDLESGFLVRQLHTLNRVLSGVNTAWNPEFVMTNLLRDVQTAMVNASSEESTAMAKAIFANIRRAIRAGFDAKRGKSTGDTSLLKEFELQGGKTGYSEFYQLEELAEDLETEMNARLANGTLYKSKQFWKKFTDLVGNANEIIESGTRFAGYLAARDAGMSKQQAAAFAKNLTVNFNKRGTAGQLINTLYLFGNASLQGSARVISVLRSAAKSKTGKTMIAAAIGFGFVMDIINRLLAGEDDEEGINTYDKLLSSEKDNNFILMLPGKNGKYLKFPMPHGFNVLPALGRNASAFMFGEQSFKDTISHILGVGFGAFNPMGNDERGILWNLTPTAVKPALDIATNSKWTGRKIRPDQPMFTAKQPYSQLVFKNTSKQLTAFTQWLNEATGGNAYESGWLDVSPGEAQHLLETASGGMGKTFLRAFDSIGRGISKDDEVEIGNVPFLRRLAGKAGDYSTYDRFRSNFEHVKVFEQAKREKNMEWLRANRWLIPATALAKRAERQIKAIKNHHSLPESQKQERIVAVQKLFNKKFKEMNEKALSKN